MTMSLLGSRFTRESRWYPVVAVAPYVVLILSVVFTVVIKGADGVSLVIDLALCVFAAAWMLWMFTLHPQWHSRQRLMAVFVGVLVGVMAVLVVRDSWFGVFAIVGYLYVFAVIPWPWQLLGVGAVALVTGTAQAAAIPKNTAVGVLAYLAILVVNVLAICGFAWVHRIGDEQIAQRQQALVELRETNQRLEASLVENAALHERLLAQARQAGVLDERQRMAREIHDTLAQGLIGIITQLQAAEHAGDEGDGVVRRRHVDAATSLAREGLAEARRSVDALRPAPLEGGKLSDALASVVAKWSGLTGVRADLTIAGDPRPISPEAQLALLRTAQEALANVAKHARASRVGLTLSYLDDQVALDIRDDGDGFDPGRLSARPGGDGDFRVSAGAAVGAGAGVGAGVVRSPSSGGFGLVAMRQRIEQLAGTLQIESEPRSPSSETGSGTAISASVPLGQSS